MLYTIFNAILVNLILSLLDIKPWTPVTGFNPMGLSVGLVLIIAFTIISVLIDRSIQSYKLRRKMRKNLEE